MRVDPFEMGSSCRRLRRQLVEVENNIIINIFEQSNLFFYVVLMLLCI